MLSWLLGIARLRSVAPGRMTSASDADLESVLARHAAIWAYGRRDETRVHSERTRVRLEPTAVAIAPGDAASTALGGSGVGRPRLVGSG